MQNVRIVVAHRDDNTRDTLKSTVEDLGHEVIATSAHCQETIQICRQSPPHLIISGIEFPDGDGVEALIQIADFEPLPSIVVTSKTDLQRVERAMDDHVMAYLIDPVDRHDLKPTIHVVLRRFAQFEDLRKENDSLKQALATRKLLERAKGILMETTGMTEEEAYLHLRDRATSNRVTLAKVSQLVIDSAVASPD